jgi:hypothetical protein
MGVLVVNDTDIWAVPEEYFILKIYNLRNLETAKE